MDNIASQAKFFNNLPLISPKYRSVVHLEDQEDKAFWDTLLQRFRPGKYFYVPYSKSNKGFDTHLHVRGHNIYDLVLYIGKRMTSSMRINFTEDVLKEVPLSGNYWEYTEIEKDLKSI